MYPSSGIYTPEEIYETVEEAISTLEAGLQQLPYSKHILDAYPAFARLYIKVGREEEVDNLINRFKSVIESDDIQAHLYLGEMLEMIDQSEELQVFEKFDAQYPNDYQVLNRLAQIHWKLGNPKLVAYQLKAEPRPELIGKPVSDFSAILMIAGGYRGKVLLNFWATWCGFCTEMRQKDLRYL